VARVEYVRQLWGAAQRTCVKSDIAISERCDAAIRRSLALAWYLVHDSDQAEDIVQEAMARAWQYRKSLRDSAAFDPWLDRIVVNVCREHIRRQRRRPITVELPTTEDMWPYVGRRDDFGAIAIKDEIGRALLSLPIEQQIVVVLRYWRDLQLDQIAERIGAPVGTVKSRLYGALAALRQSLQAEDRVNR
jgi:RNA polymerase sigma-70 factor (ECF subfamily)